jgi:hypothetical protein
MFQFDVWHILPCRRYSLICCNFFSSNEMQCIPNFNLRLKPTSPSFVSIMKSCLTSDTNTCMIPIRTMFIDIEVTSSPLWKPGAMLVMNSSNLAFDRWIRPKLPVSSHVAKRMASSLIILIHLENKEITETYRSIPPLCFHSSGDIFCKTNSSPVLLRRLTIVTFIIVGPGWSASSRVHSITKSNTVENIQMGFAVMSLTCDAITLAIIAAI